MRNHVVIRPIGTARDILRLCASATKKWLTMGAKDLQRLGCSRHTAEQSFVNSRNIDRLRMGKTEARMNGELPQRIMN